MDLQKLQQEVLNEKESSRWESSTTLPVLMRKVYTWMTLALVITGITAWVVAHSPAILQMIMTNKILFLGLLFGELILVWSVSAAINRLSLTTATLLFVLYSVLNGVTMSFIFLAYHRRHLCRHGLLRLLHQDRPLIDWPHSLHGPHRTDHCHHREHLREE